MRIIVTIDRDEDGVWVVVCPAIPGCASQGKTKDEAPENIKDSIKLCLGVRAERGPPLTIETRERDTEPERAREDASNEGRAPSSDEAPPFEWAERLRRLRAACGIWEGRTDLPTRDESREDWDRRLQRLGLEH